ncbi:MAG: hypothetical protein AUI15_14070 [Actinobacteria bacterium 13_2_20CM_2_66_6]|nr:MAG: hypothetical protein AUI15_14070 [Actinobacteria bacterium 13_2_20CM_2_66_6]
MALMLMWSGNSSARIAVTAIEAISHQSAGSTSMRAPLAASVPTAANPTASRNSSERRRGDND